MTKGEFVKLLDKYDDNKEFSIFVEGVAEDTFVNLMSIQEICEDSTDLILNVSI